MHNIWPWNVATDQSELSTGESCAINFYYSILNFIKRTLRPATEAPKLLTTLSECKHTWLSWQRDRDANMTNGRKINTDRKNRQGKEIWLAPSRPDKTVWMTSLPGTGSRRHMRRRGQGRSVDSEAFPSLPILMAENLPDWPFSCNAAGEGVWSWPLTPQLVFSPKRNAFLHSVLRKSHHITAIGLRLQAGKTSNTGCDILHQQTSLWIWYIHRFIGARQGNVFGIVVHWLV